jgi:hypothetical protein
VVLQFYATMLQGTTDSIQQLLAFKWLA